MSDAALDLLSSCFESKPAHRPDDAVVLAEQARGDRIDAREDGGFHHGRGVRRRKLSKPPSVEPQPASAAARRSPVTSPPADRARDRSGTTLDRGTSPARARHQEPSRLCSPRRGSRSVALFGVIIYIATDNGTVKITGTDDPDESLDRQAGHLDREPRQADHDSSRHAPPAGDARRTHREDRDVRDQSRSRKGAGGDVHAAKAGRVSQSRSTRRRPAPSRSPGVPKSAAPAAPASPPPRSEPEYITTVAGRIKLKLIPAGEFMMGSDATDPDAEDDESSTRTARSRSTGCGSPGRSTWA